MLNVVKALDRFRQVWGSDARFAPGLSGWRRAPLPLNEDRARTSIHTFNDKDVGPSLRAPTAKPCHRGPQ
jgi:hypothetical protein